MLPVVIAVLAVVASLALRSLGRERHARIAVVVGFALGAAAWSLAYFVTTDRERVSIASRALVGAAASANAAELEKLLAPDLKLYRGGAAVNGKEQVLALVHTTLGGTWRVKSWQVLETQAQIDGPANAITQVKVRVVPDATGFPDISWWKLDWRRTGDEWRVVGIEPTAVNDYVLQALPSVR